MNELERLFRLLVTNLSATDSARLRLPIPLAEIRDSIVPYRACRRALQLESSEDYELALMRLCAGEGGLARLDDDEVARAFADEMNSSNPDLTLIRRYEKARLTLNSRALAETSSRDPHQAFAPPAPAEPRKKGSRKPAEPVQDASPRKPSRCSRCRADLPAGRVVNFCPHCGYDQRRAHCPQCNAQLEPEWRHCVICGVALSRS